MNYEEAVWVLNELKKTGIGFTPQHMRKFEARQASSTSVGIKMLEPPDTVIDGQLIVPIVGVKVLMRTDRYPEGPFDGDVVLNNTDFGVYEDEEFIVDGLTQGTDYYFGAYPYSTNEIYDLSNLQVNRSSVLMKHDEIVKVTSIVDNTTFFPYANIVLHDVTAGTEETKHINANSSIEFTVPIYHEYYISSDPVENYSQPAETEHFVAEGDKTNRIVFRYSFSKNTFYVRVLASSDEGLFSTANVTVTLHNVTDETEQSMSKTGGGLYAFPVENGKVYYASYGAVPGYSTPANSPNRTVVKDFAWEILGEYNYDMETINITVEAEYPVNIEGQIITLHNITDNTSEEKVWNGTTLTFFVKNGKQYYLEGDKIENNSFKFIPPKTEIYMAEVGVVRDLTMTYEIVKPLEYCTWEQIAKISEMGMAKDCFEIHDTKELTMSDGHAYTMEIIDFDHDILADNQTSKAGITFMSKEVVYFASKRAISTNYYTKTALQSDKSKAQYLSYGNSNINTDYLADGGYIYRMMPEEVLDVIKKVSVQYNFNTTYGAYGQDVKNLDAYFFIPSMTELGLTHTDVMKDGGTQYNAFATSSDRERTIEGNSNAMPYWTRTITKGLASSSSSTLVYAYYLTLMYQQGYGEYLTSYSSNQFVAYYPFAFCV